MSGRYWEVRVSSDARLDIADIIRWTQRTFGVRQAQTYKATLRLAMKALTSGPDIPGVIRREDLAPGIFILHVARKGHKGRHFIVFRTGGDHVIDVLRLLHDSMDLSSHLSAPED